MRALQIKWPHCCLLLLLFFYIPAYTQISINGRVVDAITNSPVANASIYFNNTTIATKTNQQGAFSFTSLYNITSELVISVSGYELLVFKPSAVQLNRQEKFVFKLQAKESAPQNTIPLNGAIKKRWLEIFYSTVLGISAEAAKCNILNDTSIYFLSAPGNNTFFAYADKPLVIDNAMLGYKISFDLLEFSYDDATAQSDFVGYCRYEETGDTKKYGKNRKHCYYGSSLHFYRSLLAHQLPSQGFGTFLLKADTAKGNTKTALPVQQDDLDAFVPVMAQQLLYIDSNNNFSIRFNGKLLVQYYHDPYGKAYLSQNVFVQGALNKGVESYLTIKSSPVDINNTGALSDASAVSYTGYWLYERLANRLPYDYQPE